jgi:hypothetical protein
MPLYTGCDMPLYTGCDMPLYTGCDMPLYTGCDMPLYTGCVHNRPQQRVACIKGMLNMLAGHGRTWQVAVLLTTKPARPG